MDKKRDVVLLVVRIWVVLFFKPNFGIYVGHSVL